MFIHQHFSEKAKYKLWLIPGYAESHVCFDSVYTTPIAKHANIYAIDLPGFGNSPLINTSYEQVINEIVDFIQSTQPKLPNVILGHSMGGVIAVLVAARLQSVESVIIVDTNFYADNARMTAGAEDLESAQAFKQHLLNKIMGKVADQPDLARFLTSLQQTEAEGLYYWAKQGTEIRLNDQVAKEYKALRCNKYYVIGDKSFTTDLHTKSINSAHSKPAIWLANAGHWPMFDCPTEFWQTIEQLVLNQSYAELPTKSHIGPK
jgi:pimeloyl-ACP methyl ester carboxylesterase